MATKAQGDVMAPSTGTSRIVWGRGRTVLDNCPAQHEAGSFDEFARWIYADRVQADGPDAKGKQYICAPSAIAPRDDWHSLGSKAYAVGRPHRCKVCIRDRNWLGFDIDGGLTAGSLAALLTYLTPMQAIVWTTASSTDDAPRIRIILMLSGMVTRAQGLLASAGFREMVNTYLIDECHPIPLWDVSTDKAEHPLFLPPLHTKFKVYRGRPISWEGLASEAPTTLPPDDDEAPRVLRDRTGAKTTQFALNYLNNLVAVLEKAEEGGRNQALYGAAADAAKADGLDDETILAALEAAGIRMGLNPSELAKTIWSGIDHGRTQPKVLMADEEFPPLTEEQVAEALPTEPQVPLRAEILVTTGELPTVVARCEAALLAAGTNLYLRGGLIVRAVSNGKPSRYIKRPDGALTIRKAGKPDVAMDLEAAAMFFSNAPLGRPKKKSDAEAALEASGAEPELRRIKAPMPVVDAILANPYTMMPELTGIALAPIIRADGSIFATSGYDERTGLLVMVPSGWTPPTDFSREAAEQALARIRHRLRTIPFASPTSESVGIAAIVSSVLRATMDVCPMFGFTAPVAGSGKSKMAHIVSTVGTGQSARMATWSTNQEENEKMLTGAILESDPITCLDNITIPLRGSLLCSALSESVVKLRKLGASDRFAAPCRTLMLATGNNMTIHGDLNRRVLLCTIDANVERPELRQFKTEIVAEFAADRLAVISDIVTIVVAHRRAAPAPGPLWSDYREWCAWVRDPLVWLGMPDPVDVTVDQVADDPETQLLGQMMYHWEKQYGTEEVSSSAVLRSTDPTPNREEFEELLKQIGRNHMPTPVQLGRWLRANSNRPIDGRRFMFRVDRHSKTNYWRLG